MEEKKPLYKRILVKLSGEALSNGDKGILNYDFLEEIGHTIKKCVEMGTHEELTALKGEFYKLEQLQSIETGEDKKE